MKTRSSQVAKWMMRAWMFSCNLYHDFQFEPLGNRTAHCCLCDYSANVLSTTIVAFVNTVSIYALISSLATLTVTVSLSMSTKTIKKQETRRGFTPRLTLKKDSLPEKIPCRDSVIWCLFCFSFGDSVRGTSPIFVLARIGFVVHALSFRVGTLQDRASSRTNFRLLLLYENLLARTH